MRQIILACLYLTFIYPGAVVAQEMAEKVRYLRPAGAKFVTECDFTLKPTKAGGSIESLTERGKTKLAVSAKYDAKELLTGADVILWTDGKKKTAKVRVVGGKASVEREGQPAQVFDVPAGIIVTSAPDWTDTFLLCRRYDRGKGGKQSFPGLWIHPEQPSQRVTFAIERHGDATIEHAGAKQKLARFTIWLRGNSSYAAWAAAKGHMIKLVPLPYKDGATNWLVLEGFEKSVAELRP